MNFSLGNEPQPRTSIVPVTLRVQSHHVECSQRCVASWLVIPASSVAMPACSADVSHHWNPPHSGHCVPVYLHKAARSSSTCSFRPFVSTVSNTTCKPTARGFPPRHASSDICSLQDVTPIFDPAKIYLLAVRFRVSPCLYLRSLDLWSIRCQPGSKRSRAWRRRIKMLCWDTPEKRERFSRTGKNNPGPFE